MRSFASIVLLVSVVGIQMSIVAAGFIIAPSGSARRNLFAANLFQKVVTPHTQQNVIFSPASVHSLLALTYMGAGSKTAAQIQRALQFSAETDKISIAQDYSHFAKSASKPFSAYGPQLRVANRIYVNDNLKLAPQFNEIAVQYFDSEAESVHFADDASAAVQKINAWVEQQTHNKIQKLLQADSVNGDTSAVLVNAIYFKAKWENPFSKLSTHEAEFSISAGNKVSVDMMYQNEQFQYGELTDLDATALELPYHDSDLSMLILLPKKVDGLKALEAKLAKRDLNELISQMSLKDVQVFLPKFRIEYDVDLKQPLQQLGMTSMFGDTADFSGLFANASSQKVSEVQPKAFLDVNEAGSEAAAASSIFGDTADFSGLFANASSQKVSKVQPKAFLDVNEAGSEAAAASFAQMVPMSWFSNRKRFNAIHPFVFAIRSPWAVYFVGHVAKL